MARSSHATTTHMPWPMTMTASRKIAAAQRNVPSPMGSLSGQKGPALSPNPPARAAAEMASIAYVMGWAGVEPKLVVLLGLIWAVETTPSFYGGRVRAPIEWSSRNKAVANLRTPMDQTKTQTKPAFAVWRTRIRIGLLIVGVTAFFFSLASINETSMLVYDLSRLLFAAAVFCSVLFESVRA